MAKAMLIMDMPKNCMECQLLVGFIGKEVAVCTGTTNSKKYAFPDEGRPNYCPLREVPQKKEDRASKSLVRIGERIGYNKCIDEILGGGE